MTSLPLHWVDALWQDPIRPALRRHAARVEAETGRRPAPGELFGVLGEARHVARAVRVPLAGPGERLVCLVASRADGPRAVLLPALAALVVPDLARADAGSLCLLWVADGAFDLVDLPNVVDTGPEGARINAPAARRPS